MSPRRVSLSLVSVVASLPLVACVIPANNPPPSYGGSPPPPAPQVVDQRDEVPENLVVNGGFEDPAIGDGGWHVFESMPGWYTVGGPGVEVQRRVAGSPAGGDQHIELDSDASSAIAQDIPTFAGGEYQLSFRFAARPGTGARDNRLEVRWDGAVIDLVEDAGTESDTRWIVRTLHVRAERDTARLELRDAGDSNGSGTYVDDVELIDITPRT